MTLSFTAQKKNWTDKAKHNVDRVMKQSTTDVIAAMTTGQASVKITGGSFDIGKILVNTGFAINSLCPARVFGEIMRFDKLLGLLPDIATKAGRTTEQPVTKHQAAL